MFGTFWDKLSEGVAGRWTAQALGPALAFWGGGLLAWAWRNGWERLGDWLKDLDNTGVYVGLAVGGLLLLTASSTAVEWLQLTVLRLAEGYWPRLFKRPRAALTRRVRERLMQQEARWQALAEIEHERRTGEQQSAYVRLDAELACYPLDPRRLLPTRLGNVLRAAEEYPQVRYGLAMSVCWPRLWLLLPQETQETLTQARGKLNSTVCLFTWGVLFIVWTVWAWWAVPVGIVVAIVAYWGMVSAAGVYGDLLRAAFDLYRFVLYGQLRWPLPSGPVVEQDCGQELSKYLLRGEGSKVRFTRNQVPGT